MHRFLSLCIVVVIGCADAPPPDAPVVAAIDTIETAEPPTESGPAPPAPPARTATMFTLDGFQLGDDYSLVMARAPYDEPCDNDPIDRGARRFMVYGALPCRNKTFPRGTTVLFYIRHSDTARYQQPIEAFAWLGGDYFTKRSDFPVATGVRTAEADAELGPAESQFELERKGTAVVVRRHRGRIYTIVDGDKVVGFVLGPMPSDPSNEQWPGLMQMYVRYTRGPRKSS